MRILLTGASGLLGVNFLLEAARRAFTGVAVHHHHSLDTADLGFENRCLDLVQASDLEELAAQLRPDWIVHCAALTNVDLCQADPELARACNVSSTARLARLGIPMVYISTDSVFSGERGQYLESDTPHPLNVYAQTKLAGEQEVLRYAPRHLVLRTAFYGWGSGWKSSLSEWVLAQLRKGEAVPGFTDARFSPILASDLSQLAFDLMEGDHQGVFHAGSREGCSKYEFASLLAQEFGLPPEQVRPARLSASELKAPRPADISLCTQKLAMALGRPAPGVGEGLRRLREQEEGGYPSRLRSLLR